MMKTNEILKKDVLKMNEKNNAVIVYFSKDGNTRKGAKILGERLDAKLIELKEAKKGNVLQAVFKKVHR